MHNYTNTRLCHRVYSFETYNSKDRITLQIRHSLHYCPRRGIPNFILSPPKIKSRGHPLTVTSWAPLWMWNLGILTSTEQYLKATIWFLKRVFCVMFGFLFCFLRLVYHCCQCLWIVHSWLPLLFSLTFIYTLATLNTSPLIRVCTNGDDITRSY